MGDIVAILLLVVACVDGVHDTVYKKLDINGHEPDDLGYYPNERGHYLNEKSFNLDAYQNYPDRSGNYPFFGSRLDVDPCVNGLSEYNAYGIWHGGNQYAPANNYYGQQAGLQGYLGNVYRPCCCNTSYICYVCGNDGISYMNECALNCHRKYNPGLEICQREHCNHPASINYGCGRHFIKPYLPWEHYTLCG